MSESIKEVKQHDKVASVFVCETEDTMELTELITWLNEHTSLRKQIDSDNLERFRDDKGKLRCSFLMVNPIMIDKFRQDWASAFVSDDLTDLSDLTNLLAE